MKVTIKFEPDLLEDGETEVVTYTKEGVLFLDDYLYACGRAAVGAGFSLDRIVAQAYLDDGGAVDFIAEI